MKRKSPKLEPSPELKHLRKESKSFGEFSSRMARQHHENIDTISRLTAVVRALQNKLSTADANCRDLDSRLVRSEAERNGYIKQLQEMDYDENRIPDLERQLKAAQDRAATAFVAASKGDVDLQHRCDAFEAYVQRLENLIVRLARQNEQA